MSARDLWNSIFPPSNALLLAYLVEILKETRTIMTTQEQTAADLVAVKEQLVKAAGEIVGKISALEAALAEAGATSPAVVAVVADLKAVAQGLDDLTPDAPPAG